MNKLDLTNLDLNALGLDLNNIKLVFQEPSQNQASRITLTQGSNDKEVLLDKRQEEVDKLKGSDKAIKQDDILEDSTDDGGDSEGRKVHPSISSSIKETDGSGSEVSLHTPTVTDRSHVMETQVSSSTSTDDVEKQTKLLRTSRL